MKQLDYSQLIETDWAKQFDREQLPVIKEGIESGVDVSVYAVPIYGSLQMQQILMGLIGGLDVSIMLNDAFDFDQMRNIRMGLTFEAAGYEIDHTQYAKPDMSPHLMRLNILSQLDNSQNTNPHVIQMGKLLLNSLSGMGIP